MMKARVLAGSQGLRSRLTVLPVAMPSSPRAGASQRQVAATLVLATAEPQQAQQDRLSIAAGAPWWQLAAAADGRSAPVKRRVAIRKIVRIAFINRPDEMVANLFPLFSNDSAWLPRNSRRGCGQAPWMGQAPGFVPLLRCSYSRSGSHHRCRTAGSSSPGCLSWSARR